MPHTQGLEPNPRSPAIPDVSTHTIYTTQNVHLFPSRCLKLIRVRQRRWAIAMVASRRIPVQSGWPHGEEIGGVIGGPHHRFHFRRLPADRQF